MIPTPTLRYALCKDIADGLAPFATQDLSFNEWRVQTKNQTQFGMNTVILAIDAYMISCNRIALEDFVPGGCVRGTPTIYTQKIECTWAFQDALATVEAAALADDAPMTREEVFKGIHDVMGQPYRESVLKQYFVDVFGVIEKANDRRVRLLKGGATDGLHEKLVNHIKEFENTAEESIALSKQVYAMTDLFFRELHKGCENRRDSNVHDPDARTILPGLKI